MMRSRSFSVKAPAFFDDSIKMTPRTSFPCRIGATMVERIPLKIIESAALKRLSVRISEEITPSFLLITCLIRVVDKELFFPFVKFL